MITIDDFFKVELKVGTVISAEDVEGSEKLIKLQVDLGPLLEQDDGSSNIEDGVLKMGNREFDTSSIINPQKSTIDFQSSTVEKPRDIRQILSGVKQWYNPEDMVGKQVVVIANLEPRKMMGLESQGMLLAADSEEGPVFLTSSKQVPSGSKIK